MEVPISASSEAMATMNFNQILGCRWDLLPWQLAHIGSFVLCSHLRSLKVKVFRSVAHRLVLTPQQCSTSNAAVGQMNFRELPFFGFLERVEIEIPGFQWISCFSFNTFRFFAEFFMKEEVGHCDCVDPSQHYPFICPRLYHIHSCPSISQYG